MSIKNNKYKIYLDNCCYNRIFDNQNNIDIMFETIAILKIKQMVEARLVDIVWSFVLDYENSKNVRIINIENANLWKGLACEYVISNDDIIKDAIHYIKKGMGVYDAYHVACAINAKCDYFVTVDKGIIAKKDENIKIYNPINFIKEAMYVE